MTTPSSSSPSSSSSSGPSSSHDEDKSTLSNPRYTQAKHVEWIAKIDFEKRIIAATANYTIEVLLSQDETHSEGGEGRSSRSSNCIQLDTRGLDISHISIDGEAVPWDLDEEIPSKPHLGQRLTIPLPTNTTTTQQSQPTVPGTATEAGIPITAAAAPQVHLSIQYTTSPDPDTCTAAQWLTPEQTSGKVHPYLFTQCQAIHARSILPCYDCPAVKMTYDATITVPQWATAVMSALSHDDGEKDKHEHEHDDDENDDDDDGGAMDHSTPTIPTSNPNPDEPDDPNQDPSQHQYQHHQQQQQQYHTFTFHQPVPIPSYLLALAVGHLAHRDVSTRCRIWSEPCILSASASEFHQTETFLQTAEEITRLEYAWTRYDLLVLPGSFPYGGMENPCLTFVTPTLLAGDGSLVCVVAHEIAHSWTGNLVTNKTWGHFWLNEGWTTWLQRRIMNRIEHTSHDADLDAIGGIHRLRRDIDLLDPSLTSLYLSSLDDDDPDESYSSVPYEKGFHLLYALERMVGPHLFLDLVEAYLKRYAYGTITSEEFKEFCIGFWKDDDDGDDDGGGGARCDAYEKVKAFDWDLWLYGEGMPPLPEFDRSLAEAAEGLAEAWVDYDRSGVSVAQASSPPPSSSPPPPPTNVRIDHWSSAQTFCFLDAILKLTEGHERKLQISTLQLMNETYGFQTSRNAEILFRYCMLAVHSQDDTVYPTIIRFVSTQGRMKYIRPLYRAMFASPSKWSRDVAVDTFYKNKEFYHPIAAKLIAYDLTKSSSSSSSSSSSLSGGGGAGRFLSSLRAWVSSRIQKLKQASSSRSAGVIVGVAATVAIGALARRRRSRK